MNKVYHISLGFSLLILASCSSGKSNNADNGSDMDSIAVMDSMRPNIPPPPPDSGRVDGHLPPPPDGMHPSGPPPPPQRGKVRPPHKPDNMRGFDPASEDDMDDNGMSRYMENNDEEGWD
jgi:hypothetical protein